MHVKAGFTDDFRRFFFRGLAAILPTVLTLALLVWVYSLIDQYFSRYINIAAQRAAYYIWGWCSDINLKDPEQANALRDSVHAIWMRWHLSWVGFVAAVISIYVFGRFLASFIGRALWHVTERTLVQLPIIKSVYPHIKQVTDFLLAERKMKYSRVVAVEYPRKGLWSIGLVTNRGMRTLDESVQGELLTVFIPSSPTPVTGYTITVRREDVVDLAISIDDALKFTISGGVILPPSQKPTGSFPVPHREESKIPIPQPETEA